MLVKTEEIFLYFLENLKYICIYEDSYRKSMDIIHKKLSSGDKSVYESGFRKQPFDKIKFVGSFFNKKMGEYISDIDVSEFVEYDGKFIKRFRYIFENIDKTVFKYMRFFCGEDSDLIPPWHIDGQGSCSFSMEKLQNWVTFIKNNNFIPNDIKNSIEKRLGKETLSVRDLLEVEEEMKKYNSVSWSREDIIRGYAIFHDKKYDLLKTLQTYDKKKTIRYVFEYKGDFCLIDYSLRQVNKGIEEGSLESRAYYFQDPIKIIKMIKRWVKVEYTELYNEILNETTRKFTTIAFRMDMIMRIRRYKTLSEEEIKKLEDDTNNYIMKKGEEYREFIMNKDNIDFLYEKVQNLIRKLAQEGINKIKSDNLIDYRNTEMIVIYELRAIEVQKQIPKQILEERIKKGYQCPFFSIDLEDLVRIYWIGIYSLLDPEKIINCLYDVCTKYNADPRDVSKVIFSRNNHQIVKTNEGFEAYFYGNNHPTRFGNNKLRKIQKFIAFANEKELQYNYKKLKNLN